MIKNNKLKAIISSVIILLPILFGIIVWNKLPDNLITHWGADGNADGITPKAAAVFVLPVILLALHWLCLVITSLDKRQAAQNKKIQTVTFFIIPVISLFSNGMIYASAFGKTAETTVVVPLLLGTAFAVIGNYLPKAAQNRTFGIKIFWTLNNEENWNKTHRASGRIWVAAGILMIFTAFLPEMIMLVSVAAIILAAVILPIVYSYAIYRSHRKQGIEYTASAKRSKVSTVIVTVAVLVISAVLAVLMFCGEIEYDFDDDALEIEADMFTDIEIEYRDIEKIELVTSLKTGLRTNGFASARLSMGRFESESLGNYIRYTYNGCKTYIVMTVNNETVVINDSTEKKTQALYTELMNHYMANQ